eukprot:1667975-Rhodomonas_salina.1
MPLITAANPPFWKTLALYLAAKSSIFGSADRLQMKVVQETDRAVQETIRTHFKGQSTSARGAR